MIDGSALKDRQIIMLAQIQSKALEPLQNYRMDVEKAGLLAQESLHWLNILADIKNPVRKLLDIYEASAKNPQRTGSYYMKSQTSH